jgi:photosystem II stability/assembly factor-like uncharacterized protein
MTYIFKQIFIFIFFITFLVANYSSKLNVSQESNNSTSNTKEITFSKTNLLKNWQVNESKIANDTLMDVSFIDDMNGWVSTVKGNLIRHNKYDVKAGEFYRTTDGGKTWKALKIDIPNNSFISRVFFISQSKGWLVIQREANQAKKQNAQFWILETEDGGNNWITTYTLPESRLSKMVFKDNGEGWIIGSNVKKNDFGIYTSGFIHYSTNFGKTWTNIGSNLINIEKGKKIEKPGSKSSIVDINLGENGQASIIQNNGDIFTVDSNNLTFEEKFTVQDKNDLGETKNFSLGFSRFIQKTNNSFITLRGAKFPEGMLAILTDIREGFIFSETTLDDVYLLDMVKISNQEIVACGYRNTLEQKDKLNQILSRNGIIIFSSDSGETWNVLYEKVGVVLSTQNGGETWDINRTNSISEDFLSYNRISITKKNSFVVVGNNGLFLNISKK